LIKNTFIYFLDIFSDYVLGLPHMVAGIVFDVLTFAICLAMIIPLAKFWTNK